MNLNESSAVLVLAQKPKLDVPKFDLVRRSETTTTTMHAAPCKHCHRLARFNIQRLSRVVTASLIRCTEAENIGYSALRFWISTCTTLSKPHCPEKPKQEDKNLKTPAQRKHSKLLGDCPAANTGRQCRMPGMPDFRSMGARFLGPNAQGTLPHAKAQQSQALQGSHESQRPCG